MRKLELLLIRDCEAGYGPDIRSKSTDFAINMSDFNESEHIDISSCSINSPSTRTTLSWTISRGRGRQQQQQQLTASSWRIACLTCLDSRNERSS